MDDPRNRIVKGKSLIQSIKDERRGDDTFIKELSMANRNREMHHNQNNTSWSSDFSRLLGKKEEQELIEPKPSKFSEEQKADDVKLNIP